MNLRDLSTLQIALGVSVVAHAALLTVRFVDPESFNRVFKETPLEVILVNAQDQRAARQGAARSPRPRWPAAATSTRAAPRVRCRRPPSPPSATRWRTPSARSRRCSSSRCCCWPRSSSSSPACRCPIRAAQGNPSEAAAREEKRRQLVELLAEIERRVNEENARPKKRYISPATREAAYAAYVDALRRKIEVRGTENFPEAAGKKLYGELTMMVTVNHDGSILATDIVESSGNRTLDRRAQAIVRSIGAFGKFTDAMRRQADQIVLPSRFKFTRDETLETQLSSS